MIARIWKGRTDKKDADTYLEYLRKTGVRDLSATAGNEGVFTFRRVGETEAEFVMLSLWKSEAAIRLFAGEEIRRARYYPEDEKFLLELEPTVEHYEVVERK